MQTGMAKSLKRKAHEVAELFSSPRGGNTLNETFVVKNIVILSEATAAVVFHKEPTRKQAVAWFYHLNSRRKPRWEYFFITYQHLASLERVSGLLHEVEQFNFGISVLEDDNAETD